MNQGQDYNHKADKSSAFTKFTVAVSEGIMIFNYETFIHKW